VIEFYSIWPCFAATAFLLLLAACPAFNAADVPPNPDGPRISTLDGLRGFLALGVVFHHGAVYHQYLLDGIWHAPPSQFYDLIGPVGVAMFFMITGYLFWTRLVEHKGRVDWLQLYVGRAFRIGPLYLFAIAVALAIIAARSGFDLKVPPIEFAKQLSHWLALGFLKLPDINDYDYSSLVLANVTWTLRFEWAFYASLLLLAVVAGRGKLHLPFAAAALIVCLVFVAVHAQPTHNAYMTAYAAQFLLGMTSGSLIREGMAGRIPDKLASLIAAALMCVVFIGFDSVFHSVALVLIGIVFYLIASGCSLFGLLTGRPARRLGDVSYGIYLLQGLVFTLVFSSAWARSIALSSPLGHWCIVLLCATLLVALATATHVLIERPGIELGKLIAQTLNKWTNEATPR
jgi:peptidoglycan/LPS O-acetylase OafA/YrhL